MLEYIMLVSSDTETRGILYEILTNLGYKITTVLSYRELMEALKKESPDYIILDPKLSDMPIEVALNKINAINDNIKIIIVPTNQNLPEFTQDILKSLREKQPEVPLEEKPPEPQLKINTLVVDDEIETAESIKNYLLKKGYDVDVAFTGEDALLKIKTDKPDIVLLDIRLPGMDGIIILKAIKDIDKSIVVIMTSAIEDEKVIQEALKIGAEGYIVKPFNMVKLEATILSNTLNKK